MDWLDLLYAAARSFHARPEPALAWDRPSTDGALRPGDDFNFRARWEDVLEPAGWAAVLRRGGVTFWRRPAKDGRGWSATTGYCKAGDVDLLYVFSANAAPLQPQKCYSKFGAYTILQHAGDFRAAARALAGQDYGDARPRPSTNGTHAKPAGPAPWEPVIPLQELPSVLPFPLDVLPLPLRRFLREVATSKHAPVDYAAVALLAIAGGAIGAARSLTIKPGWSERPCLYAAIVAPPGSAKTPALKDVAAPVYVEQARLRAAHRAARAGGDDEARLKTAYVSDITTEALAAILQDNERGVVMVRDELTAWVAALDQYKAAGRGADRQVYLHAWSGEPISVHRKMQLAGPIFVPHPFVGIVGGLPPSSLKKLCGEDRSDDGFMDRILFCYPDPTPAHGEDWMGVSDELAAYWAQTLRQLWDLEPQTDLKGDRRPRFLRLTSSGREAWVRFTCLLADQMNDEDLPDFLHGPWAKLRGYGARLALVLHCLKQACEDGPADEVDGDSIDRAAALVLYFQSHARKVYAAFDGDPETKRCGRVLKWIAREQRAEFKRRDLLMDCRTLRNPEELDRALVRLVRHNYIREKTGGDAAAPGRPVSPTYEVNPERDPPSTMSTCQQNPDREAGEEG